MKNNLYTIPPHLPFAATLAQWILDTYGARPHDLPRILVLLPSRRACISLREAFLQATAGKPLLLPCMQPLGDVDEDMLLASGQGAGVSPNISSPAFTLKRQFILARLIHQYNKSPMDHALQLAAELAHVLDECEREQVSLAAIAGLVPDRFAAHWQVTVEFLKILSEHWPKIAVEEGLVSRVSQQNQMLTELARRWKDAPPDTPVIAAGTTGSIPATAALLATITALPQGTVILPGLDTQADEEYFSHLTEAHPQWGMQYLLTKLNCKREEVQVIGESTLQARTQLLSEIMRPAETTHMWQKLESDMRGLQGMKSVVCAHTQEEATVIALMLREVLEEKEKTAALVTHDRDLARRVAALMLRFSVVIDDSAGIPLIQTPMASFLRLILEVTVENAAPVPLLSLLKHPFTHAGMERIACLEAARTLEISIRQLGGQWPLASNQWYEQLAVTDDVRTLLTNLKRIFAPLMECFTSEREELSLMSLATLHLECAEALAGTDLWEGAEADAMASLFSELQESSKYATPVLPHMYPEMFETLLMGKVCRRDYGMHPRLKILSPIEARMQSFDRIILGGLNEGSWPPEIRSDPWFNRAMREAMGLPTPERHIGLAAHDFCMLASASEVYLIRAEKVGGMPTTPARWLVKLDVLLAKFSAQDIIIDPRWNHWARLLDEAVDTQPIAPPAPKPPLAARPREISVTQVETWLRDPYSIYAALILRLRPLKPLGQEPTSADFGNAVHKALERFTGAYPNALPENAYDILLRYGREALEPLFFNAVVEALWWPRFMRLAAFVIEQERMRRPHIKHVEAEVKGAYALGNFTLTGRADRIEEGRDGGLTIIDYKTGTLPSVKDIEGGLSSQLVLLALMMGEGEHISSSRGDDSRRGDPDKKQDWIASPPARNDGRKNTIKSLEYWQLRGGKDAGSIKPLDETRIAFYMEAAKVGLLKLIETYNNPDFPYLSTPIPSRASLYNDYEHLARVKEWG